MKNKEITFSILKTACEFNGEEWKDSESCNHPEFRYEGELEGYDEDAGYVIRSDQPCSEETCLFLK